MIFGCQAWCLFSKKFECESFEVDLRFHPLKFGAGSSPPCVQLRSCHEQLIIFSDLEDCSISLWHPPLKTSEACACIRLFCLHVDQGRNGLKSSRGALSSMGLFIPQQLCFFANKKNVDINRLFSYLLIYTKMGFWQ